MTDPVWTSEPAKSSDRYWVKDEDCVSMLWLNAGDEMPHNELRSVHPIPSAEEIAEMKAGPATIRIPNWEAP